LDEDIPRQLPTFVRRFLGCITDGSTIGNSQKSYVLNEFLPRYTKVGLN